MKNRYVIALIALLSIQQSCQAAAAVKNLLLITTTAVSTGVAAALTGKFGTTVKTISQGLLDSDTTLFDMLLTLKPTAPTPAPLVSAPDPQTMQLLSTLTEQLITLTAQVAEMKAGQQQPISREFSLPGLGSWLTRINEYKLLSALIGSVGLGAVVYASHEGTRTIVRERFAALSTALNRLRDQLMARMNGLEQQVTASTDALGSAINAVDANAVARLNVLAAHQQQGFNLLAAQLAQVTNHPAPEMAPAPVFTAEPIFTAPVVASTAAPQGNLMEAEQQGFFGRMRTAVCGWFN